MSQGVPYSFVPGTKARADEVNANFIDVLNKISDTNDKITEAITDINTSIENSNEELEESIQALDTKLDEEIAKCSNLSLSNLDAAGQAVLNNKANISQIPGSYVNQHALVVSNLQFSANEQKIVVVNNYFPDNKNYEVFMLVKAYGSGAATILVGTDLMCMLAVDYVYKGDTICCLPIPISASRKLYLKCDGSSAVLNVTFGTYRAIQ